MIILPRLCTLGLAVASLTLATADNDGIVDRHQLEDINEDRELFIRDRISTQLCLQREMRDFNDVFDAWEYRNLIFEEAGVSINEIHWARAHYTNNTELRESPKVQAVLDVIERYEDELAEIGDIADACEDEAGGGSSAAGMGALVGSKLNQSMSDRRGRKLQLQVFPSASPSQSPSQSPTTRLKGTQVGLHIEGGFLVDFSIDFFASSGLSRTCAGLELPAPGGEAGLIVWRTAIPTNEGGQHIMFDVDAGLAAYAGFAIGQFTPLGSEQPTVFEFTVGAGAGAGVGLSYCVEGLRSPFVSTLESFSGEEGNGDGEESGGSFLGQIITTIRTKGFAALFESTKQQAAKAAKEKGIVV